MPLDPGESRAAFEANVKAELAAGKPVNQAVAIAYAEQRRHDASSIAAAKLDVAMDKLDMVGRRLDEAERLDAMRRVNDRADAGPGHYDAKTWRHIMAEESRAIREEKAQKKREEAEQKRAAKGAGQRTDGEDDRTDAIEIEGINNYIATHGKRPSGVGSWAFEIDGKVHFVPGQKSFPEAKAWAQAKAKELGASRIKVGT